MKKRIIYLDNAASTPVSKVVAKEMARATNFYGNPSSFNDCGREAREYIEKARGAVARFLGAHNDELIFTSSGSESNNLAILGASADLKKKEILTTPIEHVSVLKPSESLKKKEFKIKYIKLDKYGVVDLEDLKNNLTKNTALVSVMYANNEIGTIQPIIKIGKLISDFRNKIGKKSPLFHVDACQATEYLDMNVNRLGVDLLAFNGSKIYGPRGIGVLYVRAGISLSPIIFGGEQESGLRAGTENLPVIGGLSIALNEINKREKERLSPLRDYFINKIKDRMPDIIINGSAEEERLPNNINLAVAGVSSEAILLELDKYGICAGSGSACTSHSIESSHVLKAIGLGKKYIDGAIRFSMGRQTTKRDVDYVLKLLPKVIKDLKNRYKKV